MKKARIAVLVSGGGTNLQALIDAQGSTIHSGKIALVVQAKEANTPIICAMGAGDFTSSGHYIVLVGLKDGKYIVNDPNSPENSQKLWSYEQIEGQIRNLWVIRGIG